MCARTFYKFSMMAYGPAIRVFQMSRSLVTSGDSHLEMLRAAAVDDDQPPIVLSQQTLAGALSLETLPFSRLVLR